jgi:hypothetical protein
VIADDFNAKTTDWGGNKTDKRGRALIGTLCKQGMFPIKLKNKNTFGRNGSSCQCYATRLSIDRISNRCSRSSSVADISSYLPDEKHTLYR